MISVKLDKLEVGLIPLESLINDLSRLGFCDGDLEFFSKVRVSLDFRVSSIFWISCDWEVF